MFKAQIQTGDSNPDSLDLDMDVAAATSPAERITRIVEGFLAKRQAKVEVTPELDLRTAGLSSLDLVNLMLAVESEFDLFIPETQMTPQNFRSIGSIEALVASLA
jgi:acyl carrier protein